MAIILNDERTWAGSDNSLKSLVEVEASIASGLAADVEGAAPGGAGTPWNAARRFVRGERGGGLY